MAEDSIFGTAGDPANREEPAWLDDPWKDAPTTAPPAGAPAEGSPADEAAPEATPDPATDGTQEASTPETPQATPEELAQLQAAQAAAAAGAVEATTEEPPAEGETVEETAARLWANKYQTPEALEQGYRERSDMWRRAMESAQAQEARAAQAQAERSQYEQALRSAIPMIEQAARERAQLRAWAQQYKEQTGELPPGLPADILAAPQAGPPAGMVDRRQVEQMLEQRLQAERQAMADEMQRQQEFAALQRTVTEFYQDHPEVERHGALDNEITDAMAELAYSPAWQGYVNEDGSQGVVVDPTDRNSVEVVYEAVRRPALLEILKLRPDYFTTGAGLAIARRDAALLEGVPATTEPETANVPSSRAGTRAGQRVPFVESGGGSVPQNVGPNPNDPWEQVKDVDVQARGGRSKPIFLE
jgi:hypothetical protein